MDDLCDKAQPNAASVFEWGSTSILIQVPIEHLSQLKDDAALLSGTDVTWSRILRERKHVNGKEVTTDKITSHAVNIGLNFSFRVKFIF